MCDGKTPEEAPVVDFEERTANKVGFLKMLQIFGLPKETIHDLLAEKRGKSEPPKAT